MKKILSLVLVVVMMMSMTVTAFAADEQSGTSTVTAVVPVPPAEYTIHIPADMTLEYGKGERQLVGKVSVTDVKNLADNQAILADMEATPLKSTGGNVIPAVFEYCLEDNDEYRDLATRADPTVYNRGEYIPANLYATVTVADWENAEPGEYTSTITYSFSILTFDF